MDMVSPNVAKLIEKQLEIPTPPAMLTQVLSELQNPDANAARLAKIIGGDQGLASHILRIANSPFYGLSREVRSIHQAVVILGFATVQGLVVSLTSRNIYRQFGAVEQALWEHSLAAGITAHVVAASFRMGCREEAFVAGLMHDVGKVVMNNEAPDQFRQALDQLRDEADSVDVEQSVFSYNHADVGALLIKQWHLSEDLENVAFLHHDLDLANTIAEASLELICVTNLANRICHLLGIGTHRPPESIDLADEPAVNELGAEPDRLIALLPEIQQAFEQERAVFGSSG